MSELWNPWEISERIFPKKGKASDKLRYLLNYAILAPSGHNSQPWLFRIVKEEVELHADRTRALPACDPEDRELVMACGAALLNLRVALRHFGYGGKVKIFPDKGDPDLLARVGFGAKHKPTAEDDLLFGAIPQRHTNRMPFERRAVPDGVLSGLSAAAGKESAWLRFALGENDKNRVADLVAEGDNIQMANRTFRRELAAWIHRNRAASHDGMPGYALGLSGLTSNLAPIVVRTFDFGKGQAAKDRQLASGSPVLAVLGTEGNAPENWLCAGQALERVLLFGRAKGIWVSFLNQPIEVPELLPKLKELLGVSGYPQTILRMGYGPNVMSTPRRTAGEVLMRPLR
jgi:nitroreductase